MAFRFNPRPFRWLVLAGIVAVLGATLSSFRTRTRERAEPRPAPHRISPQVSQQTQAFSLSKTLGDHTLYTVEAKEVTHFENRVVLRDASILLYGKQGERRDRIATQEAEFDPATGTLTISGEVTMHLGIPAAEPIESREQGTGDREQRKTSARQQEGEQAGRGEDSKPPVAYARGSDKPGTDSVSIVTTGLSFDQNTGIASTNQEVRFWFAQGQGSARGADYDPQSQQLNLRSAVQLVLQNADNQPQKTQRGSDSGGPLAYGRASEKPPVAPAPGSDGRGDHNDAVTRIRAASLRYQQGQSSIHLGGPVELTRNTQSLQAGGDTEILLDERRQARRVRL
ncbi:MAG: hypothetical protein ACRD88_13755, partial [Terriglobia bacterium]